jgi:tripartite-type tricarboxylate transporter receptor subunit TctC
MQRKVLALFLALAPLTLGGPATAADPVADFYKGKNVFLQIGAGNEGSYNIAGRTIAKYIGQYIPGNPTIVVQNVPGGGSLNLANQFGNTTPRDGTYFGMFNNGMPTTPLLDPKSARFDPRKFTFLGSPHREAHLLVVWHTSPAKTMDDLFKREVIVAGEAPGSAPGDFPRLTNAVLGTKFKIISGYPDQGARTLAMQRGEVDGQAGSSWTTVRTIYKDMIAKGDIKLVGAFGMTKNRELPDVPLFPLGKTEEERQMVQLMYGRQAYGKPLAVPPDVPAERTRALQAALEAVFKDADYLAEAKKLDLDVDPVAADELNQLTQNIYKTSPETIARIQKAIEAKEGK